MVGNNLPVPFFTACAGLCLGTLNIAVGGFMLSFTSYQFVGTTQMLLGAACWLIAIPAIVDDVMEDRDG